jgi:archaemetzincin
MTEAVTEPIYLVPFEHIESPLLHYLENELPRIFPNKNIITGKQSLPKASYNQYRNQYRASAFLQVLQDMHQSGKIIGICNVDIYAHNLDFVFSVAEPSEQVAIISLTRLRPIYYKMYQDESVFFTRIFKETLHALGRAYGIEHCYREQCVMSASSSIMSIDIKTDRFCADCQGLLKTAARKNKSDP